MTVATQLRQFPNSFELRYPGQYFDKESGLSYNGFRSYDGRTGRYTQADPIDLAGGWNRFAYVDNNPLKYIDPLGLAKQAANSAHCTALRRKIQNFNNDLDTRWSELGANPLGLPERIGPGEALSSTRRGHRTIINDRESRLREYERRYAEECDDEPPPPPAPTGDLCGPQCQKVLVQAVSAAGTLFWVWRSLCGGPY